MRIFSPGREGCTGVRLSCWAQLAILPRELNYNMDSKRTYMYNVVLRENDVCPQGELLTDKELERMKLHNPRRDWPKTAKAKVYAESCYISFGVRFGRVKQYLNTGE